uniref:Uncharacterized protein n=1 Tax=Rhizophora mucronata TaxID=61149 RepID=A0A2P2PH46_RHIMU
MMVLDANFLAVDESMNTE